MYVYLRLVRAQGFMHAVGSMSRCFLPFICWSCCRFPFMGSRLAITHMPKGETSAPDRCPLQATAGVPSGTPGTILTHAKQLHSRMEFRAGAGASHWRPLTALPPPGVSPCLRLKAPYHLQILSQSHPALLAGRAAQSVVQGRNLPSSRLQSPWAA